MSWIDVAIASLVVVAALRGWAQGLLRQLGSVLGRIIGLVGGAYLAISLAPHITQVAWRPLDVVLIIAATTIAGGLIMRYFGGVFSNRIHENRLGLADSTLGAGVGIVGTLLTCWFLAALLAVVPWGSVGQSINHSVILRYVGRVMPSPPAVESKLQGVLDQLNVPSLFAKVIAPTLPAIAHSPLVTTHHVASASVVAIVSYGGCGVANQGTGFVVAPGEVVTMAHLVAGERTVLVGSRVGRVVLFDPRADVAVVRVAALNAPSLPLGPNAPRGARGELVGYASPSDRVSSGAISLGPVVAPGRDIYSGPVFTRTMDLVVVAVNSSESGSPVLVRGAVSAVVVQRAVFASSLAYAIPASQIRSELAHVTTKATSTGPCVN
ncbi:MAG: CvpA family protein [Actinomycetota bacterium]|nr:CvpA family protein [Actinomycetota bacterium]